MGSKLDKDPSSDVFQEDPSSSICVIHLTQTDREMDKQTVMKIVSLGRSNDLDTGILTELTHSKLNLQSS